MENRDKNGQENQVSVAYKRQEIQPEKDENAENLVKHEFIF
jgi:hypothetical protein